MNNRKAQIEITNVMFMHLVGLIGILTFTFLFLSLITGSSARAEGLKEETIYYNYGRRLISSTDCLAYSDIIPFYNGISFKSFSRTKPGVIDVSKLLDYNHQNCLRYDLVSGAFSGDPSNPFASYPVLIYEVEVQDLSTGDRFSFINDVYNSISAGVTYQVCEYTNCQPGCLYDCKELMKYKNSDESITDYTKTSLGCDIAAGVDYDFGGDTFSRDSIQVSPRVNCWYSEFNDVARTVEPFAEGLNCSIIGGLVSGTTSESGNVFQTQLQYAVNLRYNEGVKDFSENPGILSITFCVIKIPSMCDPFFEGTTFGAYNLQVYQPDVCEDLGLPLI